MVVSVARFDKFEPMLYGITTKRTQILMRDSQYLDGTVQV